MTLPDQLLSFWYAYDRQGEATLRLPWGGVVTDSRYPLVWDTNKASVFTPSPDLSLPEIRSVLLPALERSGARHEFIEFWDLDEETRALQQLRAENPGADNDVVMVFEAEARVMGAPSIEILELEDPDEAFWETYRETRNEFGGPDSDEVVDQLVARDREQHARGVSRLFVGSVRGETAGFASLVSLEGVGYVDNVVTRPAFRRRGIASALVTTVVEASLSSGDAIVHLLAGEGGAPSRLYERLGFRVVSSAAGFSRRL